MKIKILFFAGIKEALGQSHRLMEVTDGTSIHEVVQWLGHESAVFQKMPLVFAVNENFETEGRELKDQDQLAIMTPMSGG